MPRMSFQAARYLSVALLIGTAAQSAQAQVLISQVYAGSNSTSGSPYSSDYIELYNAGATDINFVTNSADGLGWSLHYQSTTGTTWTKANITGIIRAKGYYLHQTTTPGTSFGAAIPPTDAASSSVWQDLSTTGAKIALLNSTGTLSAVGLCTGPVPSSGTIQDAVGYGSSSNCSEPFPGVLNVANLAPTSTNTLAIFRKGCGATDTNNSGADWSQGLPNPRNSALSSGGAFGAGNGMTAWGNVSPNFVRAGGSVLVTVTPRLCAGGNVLGATVMADLSLIGQSASSVLVDTGASGDEVAGDGVYSLLTTIASGTATGTKNMPYTVTSGGSSAGGYLTVQVLANTAPVNDSCRDATFIAGPYTGAGQTVTATIDLANPESYNPMQDSLPASGFSIGTTATQTVGASGRKGVWYTVAGSGTTMSATTCGSGIADTVLIVMCGTCDGLARVTGSNDNGAPTCGTSSLSASATWCAAAGTTYFIWVAPSSATTGSITLNVTDNGVACTPSAICSNCIPACGAGSTLDNETTPGPALNDGCDAITVSPNSSNAHLFRDLTIGGGEVCFCGTSRALFSTLDGDWYRFSPVSSGTFAARVTAQFPVNLQVRQLSSTGTCTTNAILATNLNTKCMTASLTFSVTAGSFYALRVAPGVNTGVSTTLTSGFSIGGLANLYTGCIGPAGACCLGSGMCAVLTSADCAAQGGTYQGDNSTCGTVTYAAAAPGTTAVEDISTDPAAAPLYLGDDNASAAISLPFTFSFFGLGKTKIFVNSNGWLQFTNDNPTATQMRAVVVPLGGGSSTAVPNDMVAAYMRDLNQNVATSSITHMVRGTAPNRRYIVLWKAIPVFGGTDSNTFEILLYEGSNCVELRWGAFTVATANTSFAAGLENSTGTAGVDVPATSVTQNGSRLFCPSGGQTCPQPTGACCITGMACQMLTQAACQIQGGVYNGDGSSCSPDPCVSGACCLPQGGCQDGVPPTVCTNTLGGTYQGDFSMCATVNPPCPPSGSCCAADGSCSITTQANCSAPGQVWTLGGACSPSPCVTGACCFPNGSCATRTAVGCMAQGGVYQGNNAPCTTSTFSENFDGVVAPTLPAGWTATNVGST
ncbi:MAG TPA: lamin tail domain-containing protein, partial [Phycisphaerae bacterium]